MKVLLINSLMNGGGIDSHTLSLTETLVRQGCDVTLAVPEACRWLAKAQAAGAGRLIVMRSRRSARWIPTLAALVRSHGIDIIHAHHGRDYWVAVAVSLLTGSQAHVVVTRHLMTPLSWRSKLLLSVRGSIISVSDAVQKTLGGITANRKRIHRRIYCGVDTRRFHPEPQFRRDVRNELGVPMDAFVFVLIGGADRPSGKGQRTFLQAASLIQDAHPDAYFLCVGNGELVPELLAEATRCGLEDRFRSIPFQRDVPRLLQGIDVLVHPPTGTEALGLVILEALSCARPVIASALDGIPETFLSDVHGLLIPPGNAAALALAMSELAGNPGKSQEMGRQGRRWVEKNFSIEGLGAHTVAMYEDCLATHQRA